MAATIRDIKKRTGLSLATISKYLNGGNVLPENRILIEEAINELHYEVNELARGLVTHKTKTIGVLVYDIQCLFVGSMLHYLGMELHKKGYGMLICDSCNDEKLQKENLQFLLSRKVDGILVFAVGMHGKFLHAAKKANVPVVLVDRSFQDEEYDCVEVDNRTAIYRATNKLIENHHKKIAVIASNTEYTGRERVKGYSDAMNQAGLEIPKEYCKLGGHSFEHGYRGMKELLELEDRPTGVILGNYNTMLGGIMALNESGLSCPQDVSLIGVDNLPMTQVLRPKLWLIVQPMETMCEKAVAMLLERVNGEQNGMPVKISFSTSVREGDSIRDLG